MVEELLAEAGVACEAVVEVEQRGAQGRSLRCSTGCRVWGRRVRVAEVRAEAADGEALEQEWPEREEERGGSQG